MSRKASIALAVSGWFLWVSFLVTPVVAIPKGVFLGFQSAPEIIIRGWELIRGGLYGAGGLWRNPDEIGQVLLGLANVLVIVSPFALFSRHARFRRICGFLAVSATLGIASSYALTQGWEWSGPGYWLWLASFVLVSASLLVVTRSDRPEAMRDAAG